MIPTATLVSLGVGAAFALALPTGLLIWWRKTRGAKLLPFFAGALVWFVFAAVLEPLLHNVCLARDNAVSRALNGNAYLYMLYAGLAAGVFEETGRYLAFRRVLRKSGYPGRDTAVTFGIGHGGAEAVLLLGSLYATYLALAVFARQGSHAAALALAGGDAQALAVLLGRLGQITGGAVLLAMLERAAAMALHIALSCFVFLAARDRSRWAWFPFAILLHAIVDMPAALYQRGLLPAAAAELWAWVVALHALRSARKRYLEAMDP